MKFFLLLTLIFSSLIPDKLFSKEINIGLSDVAPFAYMKDDKLVGINVDILKQLEKETGLKFIYILYPHARLTNLMSEEDPDMTIVFRIVCDNYKSEYESSKKLYSLKPSIYLKKNVNPGKQQIRIGRVLSTCKALANKHVKQEEIVDVATLEQAFKMIKVGRLDGICGNEAIFNYALKKSQSERSDFIIYRSHPDSNEFDGVVCRKKSMPAEVKKKLDQAIEKVVIPNMKSFAD